MAKSIKKGVSFPPRVIEMGEEIKDRSGYGSFSAVLHESVRQLHQKTFPKYLRNYKQNKDTGEIVSVKERNARINEESMFKAGVAVCELLNGTLKESVPGQEFPDTCVYFTYEGKKRYEQEVGLTMLDHSLVNSQYFPNKDAVLKRQKKGEVDYEL